MTKQSVKARVIKAAPPAETTKQIYADEFADHYTENMIMEPPYNLKELKMIAEYSTMLQQCVDAYRTNILGFGFDMRYTKDINSHEVDPEEKAAADKEWQQLEEFIKHLHFDESAETLLGFCLEDREKTGNGYIEVIRNGKNQPAGIEYMAAEYVRVCKLSDPIEVPFKYFESGQLKTMKRQKRFRKYAQMIDGRVIYFKEYGDPRTLNLETGQYEASTPIEKQANEVVHFKIGSGAYGKPRWIGHIVNLYGARKAEELNFMYFKQGRHIPAAITIENGMLSEDSYKQLQDYMNGLEGVENSHKFLLLEAEGIAKGKNIHGDEEIVPVKVDIKSLAEILQEDALFLEYDQKSRDKIRSAFRLPPIYTGEAQDYNRATADTARKITEEQVFQPERKILTGRLNALFLNDLEIHKVELQLKGPDFQDPLEIAKVLTPFITAGAVSPNDLRDLAGRVLGKTLEEWPEEEYNRPIGKNESTPAEDPFTALFKSRGGTPDVIGVLKDMRDVLEDLKNEQNR
ncbi:phage portal protein [Bacillus velezensis]|uniref:phage portal protein n=1 Tax=Bacillus velezensis TaxID=492670 RepID=UPI003CFFF4AE